MRMELRVCEGCLAGDHDDPAKAAVSQDMVACAEVVSEHKELVGLDAVYVTKLRDGDGADGALPAIAASIEDGCVRLADTQLVMEDDDGNLLVYAEAADVLQVLTRNVDQIGAHTTDDVGVDLGEAARRLVDES
ncbi:hypothetical protein [Halobaculum marinum]|uniref:Uncharacterized protein n=1 Tax=Halobaculum marinum TaxID=3031996 RepID=A0ABD5WY69_9EURY|nr:hypothetical protein [Halobaculum sp. DT55]